MDSMDMDMDRENYIRFFSLISMKAEGGRHLWTPEGGAFSSQLALTISGS